MNTFLKHVFRKHVVALFRDFYPFPPASPPLFIHAFWAFEWLIDKESTRQCLLPDLRDANFGQNGPDISELKKPDAAHFDLDFHKKQVKHDKEWPVVAATAANV